ncbi:hypothetical protein PHLGIDRAFT_119941 [Phlebiopsis gigantea 11061_1 CR5-6]|uniref:Uncharacterized protein n=1 Tax=Phlebiopsis gigantea (strain 11061_1 CR5-6) TaxID=745531 RepID=A0A0C3S8F7_PHLG1|nr:hypothetical protein PHLGIDRAFT_119941 [Phlebiopsis gigantea 11061_1 CR5-6]
MSLPLTGKVALVTGSSRSIGAAIVKRLAVDGASVVVNYVNAAEAAQRLVDSINAEGHGTAVAIKADVSSVAAGRMLVEDTVSRFGRLDVLVLNAGYVEMQDLEHLTEDEFDRHVTVNAKVPLFMVQAAAKRLQEGGRVVFLSSSTTKFSGVFPAGLAYTAAKGAVEQMTRVLAKDLGARGITVNAVAPGSVETEMLHKGKSPEVVTQLANLNPQKRIPEASEIAPIIAFLAREEAGWVNGQTIFVNGGATL